MFVAAVIAIAVVFPLQSEVPGPRDGESTLPDDHGQGSVHRESAGAGDAGQPAAAPHRDTGEDEIGQWLVNLARHQGHLVGRKDPRAASLHVLALLEAATEVAPQFPESYYWLYDLYHRLGRTETARHALSRYVQLAPQDDGARLFRFEMEMQARQTAEARAEFVRSELAGGDPSPIYESRLRGWLGRHDYENRRMEEAGHEVEQALRLNPANLEARETAYELYGETEAPLQRVEMALQLIAMSPSQVNLVWDLAELLDRLSLHRPAQEWYTRAMDLHRRSESGPIPADLWQKLALSYMASESFAEAKKAADEALKAQPDMHAARLLRASASEALGDTRSAEADRQHVQKAYEARYEAVLAEGRSDEAVDMAWFYAYHAPDKDKALKLAEVATAGRSPPALARLAKGYALSANGRVDEALKVLKPLSETDPMAALERARLLIQRGDKGEALTILHKAADAQPSGIAYRLIRDLLKKQGEEAPPTPLRPRIVAALERFPRDVFDYYRRTGDFLKFTLSAEDNPAPPTGPINLVLRLENAGPFPITFGEGFMSRPLVAVTAELTGPETRRFESYLQVMMSERPVLMPGASMEKRVAVDVGPVREALLATATESRTLTVSAMFDPVYREDRLVAGLGSVTAGPIRIGCRGIDTSLDAVGALLDRAANGDVSERIIAANQMGALLAAAEAGRVGPGPLPVDGLRSRLARLLGDGDWHVRAHALVAAGWSPVEKTTTLPAAAKRVGDRNPAVRVLAVRLFAEQQRDEFAKALSHISLADPSQAVRTMARSYLSPESTVQARTDDPID